MAVMQELGQLLGFFPRYATVLSYSRFLIGLAKKVLQIRFEDIKCSWSWSETTMFASAVQQRGEVDALFVEWNKGGRGGEGGIKVFFLHPYSILPITKKQHQHILLLDSVGLVFYTIPLPISQGECSFIWVCGMAVQSLQKSAERGKGEGKNCAFCALFSFLSSKERIVRKSQVRLPLAKHFRGRLGKRRGPVSCGVVKMNMMRRIKSIASGRSSFSDPVGSSSMKRIKVEQDKDIKEPVESLVAEKQTMSSTSHSTVEKKNAFSTRTKSLGFEQLPKELDGMRIKDDKTARHEDKVSEPVIINCNGTETGQIISTTIGGQNGQPKKNISYMAERIVGTGSFGVVFQAKCLENGEIVAIKKVLQDKRYKNRELQIMQLLDHPNVVQLKHHFYSTTSKDQLYLNLVLEYVPETLYRVLKQHNKIHQHMPLIYVKLYIYQICHSLAYVNGVIGVCHRDIKPQNLLVDPQTHQVKLCDFGSAKVLIAGEPNISYICSRYYRAPELIFGATEYTTAIDMWSVGCVFAELLLGRPLFPGESGVDQLVEVIKVLGTPTREEIKCMNPNYTEFKFPQFKPHPWHKLFSKKLPSEAVDLVSRMLQYSPKLRCTPLEACAHPFFDELRDPETRLPNGHDLPPLFNFSPKVLAGVSSDLIQRLSQTDGKK